jgi:hypothetical protein
MLWFGKVMAQSVLFVLQSHSFRTPGESSIDPAKPQIGRAGFRNAHTYGAQAGTHTNH